MTAALTATPLSATLGATFTFAYTGSLGGSLRITRPDGSRFYFTTVVGSGTRAYRPTVAGGYRGDLFTARRPATVIASATFGATAVIPTPPVGAVRVAVEGGSFVSTGAVWYGANGVWASRTFAAGTLVACSNATFGDPAPNVKKECRAVVVPGALSVVSGNGLIDLAWTA